MKRPPILIIINLILLTAGYLYCAYLVISPAINERLYGDVVDIVALFSALLFLTLCIIGIYVAVFKRHARSVLLLGAALSLSIIGLIPGIIFIIWSVLIFDENNNPSENTFIRKRHKSKYWIYSAIIFCAASILLGLWGSSLENQSRIYESLKHKIYTIMVYILIMGIVQLVIYYILSKIRDYREKRVNNP